jgi:hypothetical protein
MNDKYKDYFNDEGEFLIPFEDIQRGKRPRKLKPKLPVGIQMIFVLICAAVIGILCGFGFIVTVIYR